MGVSCVCVCVTVRVRHCVCPRVRVWEWERGGGTGYDSPRKKRSRRCGEHGGGRRFHDEDDDYDGGDAGDGASVPMVLLAMLPAGSNIDYAGSDDNAYNDKRL